MIDSIELAIFQYRKPQELKYIVTLFAVFRRARLWFTLFNVCSARSLIQTSLQPKGRHIYWSNILDAHSLLFQTL